MNIAMNWITSRFKEPSSYAALGGVGVVGFLLKEKGVI
tara:strand:+ start:544 stop:657 length:114 start_codon:yes stop_codon:yes gene_type:complete